MPHSDDDDFDFFEAPHGEVTIDDNEDGFLHNEARVLMYRRNANLPRICRVCKTRQLRWAPLALACRVCDKPDPEGAWGIGMEET